VPAGVGFEVIIYDDCSTDGTVKFLAAQEEWLRIVRGQRRGWFAANVNRLAALARGPWLCLLNNDTILQPDWLAELLATAQAAPNAAVIGNYHRYPHTRATNHAGIVFDSRASPRHLYEGLPETLPATFKVRRFQGVSAACCLIPAQCYAALGGLDEAFRNGWEDLDFSLRAIEAGYEVWYCGRSRIDHYGQSTSGRMAHEEANRRLFLSRWQNKVRPDQEIYWRDDICPGVKRSWPVRVASSLWRNQFLLPLRHCLLNSLFGIRLRERVITLSAAQPDQFRQAA
jgi:GT2 family glycosyltransferase